MSAATDWVMADQRRRNNRSYLSDIDVQVVSREPASAGTISIPAWQGKVMNRLRDLVCLRDNWDSYGASRPSINSAVDLVSVLGAVMAVDTPAPSIVPSPLGHFQAEWHRNGVDLEVEVVSPTKILVSYSDAINCWDRELKFDFTLLVQAVRRVGHGA